MKTINKLKLKDVAMLLIKHDYNLKCASPEFCIQLLESLNVKMLTKLHRHIKFSDHRWIRHFINGNGLFSLLKCIEKILNRTRNHSFYSSIILSKCLSCIKELMNSKKGMESIIDLSIEDHTCIQILAKSKKL